jgi:hypothetical protein
MAWNWLRIAILTAVAILVLVAGGCVARYLLIEAQLQQEVFPSVRGEAEEARALASQLGLVERDRMEYRLWFDPFCQLSGIPANRLSVVTRYRLPTDGSANEVVERYHSALEAAGWSLRRGVERGLSEGWRGRYRIQTTLTSEAEGGTLLVEVRNEDRTASGCFK